MRTLLLLATVLPAMAGCQGGTAPDPRIPASASRLADADVVPIWSQSYSRITARERDVVRTTDEWLALWSRIAEGSSGVPRPDPDFTLGTVIVAAMGSRSTGGFGVSIEGVYEDAGQLFVMVRERSPGPHCFTTQAFTSPVVAVAVARRGMPVVFVERAETVDCG